MPVLLFAVAVTTLNEKRNGCRRWVIIEIFFANFAVIVIVIISPSADDFFPADRGKTFSGVVADLFGAALVAALIVVA